MRSVDGRRVPQMMNWGLIPHWAKDTRLQYSTFNARSEEFTAKPAFKDAWKRGQRCLVVTNGFYEWKKITKKEIEEKAVRPEVLPTAPAIPKPEPVELIFDEADALFRKRTDP